MNIYGADWKGAIVNKVYFIGAGPGDPELITLKGRRLLDLADVVIYAGSLVNPGLLNGIKAEIHNSASMTLDDTIEILVSAVKAGKLVVRLHTGDPAFYSAISEQIERLGESGIGYEVVPGVSSAMAGAALLGQAPQIGRRHPAYASAGGLASMALRLDESVIMSMSEELRQLTPNTIKTRTELLTRLDEVRKTGYALDLEEAYPGVRCVGVAVAAPNWPVVHVSLSVPLQRAPIERLHALAKPLKQAQAEIERILRATPRK